jgi:hypothetical protein
LFELRLGVALRLTRKGKGALEKERRDGERNLHVEVEKGKHVVRSIAFSGWLILNEAHQSAIRIDKRTHPGSPGLKFRSMESGLTNGLFR